MEKLRTIIAGSRSATNYEDLINAVSNLDWEISTVISGTARGADKLGEKYAKRELIDLERYPADWDIFGKQAGHIRNEEMAEVADAVILLWDGVSPGTKNMLKLAKKYKLRICVKYI